MATAFGPGNTYLLLHILYGSKYSDTEAPAALALYCPYILLLATNGILECFVQAVSRGPELKWGHFALIVITAIQGAATLKLVVSQGTMGMILADALGMALRVAFCLAFIVFYARQGTERDRVGLREALPSSLTLISLGVAALGSNLSLARFLGRGWLVEFAPYQKLAFKYAAVGHVATNAVLLSGCAFVMFRQEHSVLAKLSGRKRE